MGDCACCVLTSPTIPRADAATVKLVRVFFSADPGTVLQHLRLRKRVGWLISPPQDTAEILSIFIVFGASFDMKLTVTLRLDVQYISQYTSGAFIFLALRAPP